MLGAGCWVLGSASFTLCLSRPLALVTFGFESREIRYCPHTCTAREVKWVVNGIVDHVLIVQYCLVGETSLLDS